MELWGQKTKSSNDVKNVEIFFEQLVLMESAGKERRGVLVGDFNRLVENDKNTKSIGQHAQNIRNDSRILLI